MDRVMGDLVGEMCSELLRCGVCVLKCEYISNCTFEKIH